MRKKKINYKKTKNLLRNNFSLRHSPAASSSYVRVFSSTHARSSICELQTCARGCLSVLGGRLGRTVLGSRTFESIEQYSSNVYLRLVCLFHHSVGYGACTSALNRG